MCQCSRKYKCWRGHQRGNARGHCAAHQLLDSGNLRCWCKHHYEVLQQGDYPQVIDPRLRTIEILTQRINMHMTFLIWCSMDINMKGISQNMEAEFKAKDSIF